MTLNRWMKEENKRKQDKEQRPADQMAERERKRKTCDDGRRRGGGMEEVNWVSAAVLQCDTSAFWESSATNAHHHTHARVSVKHADYLQEGAPYRRNVKNRACRDLLLRRRGHLDRGRPPITVLREGSPALPGIQPHNTSDGRASGKRLLNLVPNQ